MLLEEGGPMRRFLRFFGWSAKVSPTWDKVIKPTADGDWIGKAELKLSGSTNELPSFVGGLPSALLSALSAWCRSTLLQDRYSKWTKILLLT